MSQAGASYESSLLLTLEEISQLVAHSHDPAETLANIVRLIQGRFHTAVCSVYILHPEQGELVLSATVGLKREGIGKVRMRLDEGLTGLTAEKMAPVMVADAFQHPRFKYFPDAGEDPYHSFLGVPLVEGGELQGVLVVQTMEPRVFSQNEIRMLVTVAAQVAALVGDARLLEQASAAAHEAEDEPAAEGEAKALRGTPLSPGVGVGAAYVVGGLAEWREAVPLEAGDLETERRRLHAAMEEARDEIVRLGLRIAELVGEEHGGILHAQLMILQDRTIERDLDACLRSGATAEAALLDTLDKYVAAFQKLSTPFFQERIYDVKDVFHRVLWRLRPRREADPAGERQVLVAREASVMELFAADLELLAAVVVEHGGPQSHAAILARSLGVPMAGQVEGFERLMHPGRRLLVNGTTGEVLLDPAEDAGSKPPDGRPGASPPPPAAPPAPARPGLPRVEVNLNLLCEAGPAVELGAVGVGLFRSEFLFLARRTLPTEDEQVGIYRKLLKRLAGRPVTIRTFDLRPDKSSVSGRLGLAASARPYDWRLVLESLPLRQLFHEQVRAILRAATQGPARVLVPLVTRTELLDFVVETAAAAREELRREGLEHSADVPFGLMIETAASAPMVGDWAARAAFFALGTNDLAASALGLDRDHPAAAAQMDPLHPGVLRLLDGAVVAAHAAGRPVSVCGEMAADPLGAAALAALGVDCLSVPVTQLPASRQAVAALDPAALAELRPALLGRRTSAEVRKALGEWREGAGLPPAPVASGQRSWGEGEGV
jgi:phosphotransferase system enzyme I (PtsP)